VVPSALGCAVDAAAHEELSVDARRKVPRVPVEIAVDEVEMETALGIAGDRLGVDLDDLCAKPTRRKSHRPANPAADAVGADDHAARNDFARLEVNTRSSLVRLHAVDPDAVAHIDTACGDCARESVVEIRAPHHDTHPGSVDPAALSSSV
jgi:hypothetical protein